MFTPDADEQYRTCAECGRDCEPVPFQTADDGIRISFICPVHGVHSEVDPFDGDDKPLRNSARRRD